MANGFPVWSMGQMRRQSGQTVPPRWEMYRMPQTPPRREPPPERPEPVRIPDTVQIPKPEPKDAPASLLKGIPLDGDSLLLLALIWLLRKEDADRRLLLALLYILL